MMTILEHVPSNFTPELKSDFIRACRMANLDMLRLCLFQKDFHTDEKAINILRDGYLIACANKRTEVIQYLMTSKDFKPNQLSVRGVEVLFNNKHEEMIHWLIFDYGMNKSAAVEEVLIEMGDQDYARYIEGLFEKRALNQQLQADLEIKPEKLHKI